MKGKYRVSKEILIDVCFLQALWVEIWTLTCVIERWHLIYNFLMLMQNKTTFVQSLNYILKLIPIQVLHTFLSLPCTLLPIYSMLQILLLLLLNAFNTHICNCPLCVLIYSAFFSWGLQKLCLLFNSLEQHFYGWYALDSQEIPWLLQNMKVHWNCSFRLECC